MANALHLSGLLTVCRPRFIVLLILMFCAPPQAFSATVTGNIPGLYPELAGSPALIITSPASSRDPLKGVYQPDGIVSARDQKKSPAMYLPASDTSIASGNRLLLFFLLLMAGIFGLLVEIAGTRRKR
jgi:hypothetical protein